MKDYSAQIAREYFKLKKVYRYCMVKIDDMDDNRVCSACHQYCEANGLWDEYCEYRNRRNNLLVGMDYLGESIDVVIDRPLGSTHPKHKSIVYPLNYGYYEGFVAPDGEEQDVYVMGVYEPVSSFSGKVIAIVHRLDDIEDKWVVAPEECSFSKEDIIASIKFQEQYFNIEIIM